MRPEILPAGVLSTIAENDFRPDAIVEEISTITNSRRYAIFRLTKISRIHLDVIESSLDPEVSEYLSGLLSDEVSEFGKKTCSATAPFCWDFSSDPEVERRAARKADDIWAELAKSNFCVFFRRCSAAEKVVFVSQSVPGTEPLDDEQLFYCHGLAQVIFDRLTMRLHPRTGASVRITARERECLRWCAEGKTSEEIGIILSLSTHTVNHYLISATKKLNAVNRMHAITIAVRHGVLDINSEP